ncbi:MAG: porin [Prevotella sp.]|nr:porin [Prevotella sp.]
MRNKILALSLCVCAISYAQEEVDYTPKISGTLRGKYEYQTNEKEGRFEVRTARVSFSGKVMPNVAYKAEIDLCDEGAIKMLDAYTRVTPWRSFNFTIGQMRVPFTIDAHRSPHQQYFANRSFIAKQVGNVRDVGAMAAYQFKAGVPVVVQAGLFNGSGLTGQKDYWTKGVNFSAKTLIYLPCHLDLQASIQKIKPDNFTVMMYDAGMTYHYKNFLAEAEYLYKTYAHNAYKAVHAVDAFVNYDIPVKKEKSMIKKVSPLVRYDFMSDHSDGIRYLDGEKDKSGVLITNDYQRHRVTGGVTLSLSTPFISDIRINFEKYFYRANGVPKTSERDKIVVEFMTHF